MARKESLTKEQYDALPDSLKAQFKLVGDKYEFEFESTEDVAGLKSALDAQRKEAKEAKAFAARFDGLDPDKARQAQTDLEKAEEARLRAEGNWDQMKDQMLKEIQEKQIAPLVAERDKYKTATEKYLIESQLRAAIGDLKPHEGAADIILPHAMRNIRVVEENGNLVARVYDGDNPRVDAKGEPVSFSEYAERDFRQSKAFGLLFQPSGTSGSGAPQGGTNNGNANGKTMTRAQFDAMPVGERTALVQQPGFKITD